MRIFMRKWLTITEHRQSPFIFICVKLWLFADSVSAISKPLIQGPVVPAHEKISPFFEDEGMFSRMERTR